MKNPEELTQEEMLDIITAITNAANNSTVDMFEMLRVTAVALEKHDLLKSI